jgi:molybdopterin-guanine dinucleotide biosynthesis protein A
MSLANAPKAAAILLAGGKSSRLGRDKASEPLLGRPMLQHVIDRFAGLVDEYVVVRARGQVLTPLSAPGGLVVVEDLYPEIGPLGGIYTGLSAARAPFGVAVACDMPLLQPRLLAEIVRLAGEHDLVVPVSEEFPQPLCAAYGKACLPPIREQIEKGDYKITAFFGKLRPRYLRPDDWRPLDPEGRSFQNVNRDDDLRRVEALLLAEAEAAQ